jgi:protein-tyrosine phosphatase
VREFDPDAVAAGTLETGDPWYGGAEHFARCFAEVEAACRGILLHIKDQLDSRQADDLQQRVDTDHP